jgi:hypothetical protein
VLEDLAGVYAERIEKRYAGASGGESQQRKAKVAALKII